MDRIGCGAFEAVPDVLVSHGMKLSRQPLEVPLTFFHPSDALARPLVVPGQIDEVAILLHAVVPYVCSCVSTGGYSV
jgi:hypothetical protein